jgi:hypothetical protein
MPGRSLLLTGGGAAAEATSGFSVFIVPWMDKGKANTNWGALTQASGELGGGTLTTDSSAQNNEISWDIWLGAGTYKFALIYSKFSNRGIFSVQLDAVEKGNIDSYGASATSNNYSEITGIAVASAGIKTFKLKMATKNASSSAYWGEFNSAAWIRTGA